MMQINQYQVITDLMIFLKSIKKGSFELQLPDSTQLQQ